MSALPASSSSRSSEEILRERARAIAAEPRGELAPSTTIDVIEFGLADERYALELGRVGEILPLDQLTPVPCTPAFFRGIITVRGRIVAVIDLKRFFELPDHGITDLHRVILVQDGDVELGILADYVVGTRSLSLESLQPPLPTLTGIRLAYLRGVTAERLIILDAQHILADPKLIVNEEP